MPYKMRAIGFTHVGNLFPAPNIMTVGRIQTSQLVTGKLALIDMKPNTMKIKMPKRIGLPRVIDSNIEITITNAEAILDIYISLPFIQFIIANIMVNENTPPTSNLISKGIDVSFIIDNGNNAKENRKLAIPENRAYPKIPDPVK